MGRVVFLWREPLTDLGAFSMIYRPRLALKMVRPERLDEESRSMFQRELAIWAGFKHENILPLLEIIDAGCGEWAALMQWCPGTLRDPLKAAGKLSLQQATAALSDVVNGLAHVLESDGVLHLDLRRR